MNISTGAQVPGPTVSATIRSMFRAWKGRPCLGHEAEAGSGRFRWVTFDEVHAKASSALTLLKSLGVDRGAMVGICGPNSVDYLQVELALLLGGYVLVPLSTHLTAAFRRHIVNEARLSAVFLSASCAGDFSEALAGDIAAGTCRTKLITWGPAAWEAWAGLPQDPQEELEVRGGDAVPSWRLEGRVHRGGGAADWAVLRINYEDPAAAGGGDNGGRRSFVGRMALRGQIREVTITEVGGSVTVQAAKPRGLLSALAATWPPGKSAEQPFTVLVGSFAADGSLMGKATTVDEVHSFELVRVSTVPSASRVWTCPKGGVLASQTTDTEAVCACDVCSSDQPCGAQVWTCSCDGACDFDVCTACYTSRALCRGGHGLVDHKVRACPSWVSLLPLPTVTLPRHRRVRFPQVGRLLSIYCDECKSALRWGARVSTCLRCGDIPAIQARRGM